MEINNLEVNILYFMCNPLNGQVQDGAIDSKAIFEEFSDIPDGHVIAAFDSMGRENLIVIDRTHSRLSITQSGINRLQSSIACRIHHFEPLPLRHLSRGASIRTINRTQSVKRNTDDERIEIQRKTMLRQSA
jgi:hypothetical protein